MVARPHSDQVPRAGPTARETARDLFTVGGVSEDGFVEVRTERRELAPLRLGHQERTIRQSPADSDPQMARKTLAERSAMRWVQVAGP